MAVLVGIVGAFVGFAVGIVFTEIVFANSSSWPDVVPMVPVVLAVVGWLGARELVGRRRRGVRTMTSASR